MNRPLLKAIILISVIVILTSCSDTGAFSNIRLPGFDEIGIVRQGVGVLCGPALGASINQYYYGFAGELEDISQTMLTSTTGTTLDGFRLWSEVSGMSTTPRSYTDIDSWLVGVRGIVARGGVPVVLIKTQVGWHYLGLVGVEQGSVLAINTGPGVVQRYTLSELSRRVYQSSKGYMILEVKRGGRV